jgi:hypothetical protein
MSVKRLIIPSDKWKFNYQNKFPEDIKSIEDKIWYIKKCIRMFSYFNMKTLPLGKNVLPKGLCLFKKILTNSELDKLHMFFNDIFSKHREYKIMMSDQSGRGLQYLFTGDDGKKQYYKKTMDQIKRINIEFFNIMRKHIFYIIGIYKKYKSIQKLENFLDKKCQIIILKYMDNRGIFLHIDNVARYDRGPIITSSVGPRYSYADFTPTLLHEKKNHVPLRYKIPQGDILVMDGPSRMEWAHGLPSNANYEKPKYTILLKFDKFGRYNCVNNKILNTNICYSKVIC